MGNSLKYYVLKFEGTVNEAGVMTMKNRSAFMEQLPLFAGCEVEGQVRIKRSYETDQQRKYYFGVIVPYIVHAFRADGWDANKEIVHAYLKKMFAYEEIPNPQTSEFIQVAKSTADMSTLEFTQYIDRILRWSDDKGWIIPDPDPTYHITTD